MANPRVLSVGQCGVDHSAISRFLKDAVGAETTPAATAKEAVDAVRSGGYDLVLVNRVFDRDGGSGLDLIRDLKADPSTAEVPVILVSNYEDAQQQAAAVGALPGFGKAELEVRQGAIRREGGAAAAGLIRRPGRSALLIATAIR